MSFRRKQTELHRALRQSGLYKQRVVQLKTKYKRRSKHQSREFV